MILDLIWFSNVAEVQFIVGFSVFMKKVLSTQEMQRQVPLVKYVPQFITPDSLPGYLMVQLPIQ